MTFHGENTKIGKFQINAKEEDVPCIHGGMLSNAEIKPRGYGEYTKKCDNNSAKIGLRQ